MMKLVRWLVPMLVVTAIAVGYRVISEQSKSADYDAKLAEQERIANQGLPKKYSDYVTHLKVKIERRQTSHFYQLDTDDETLKIPADFQSNVRTQICAVPATATEINRGVSHSFNYANRKGRHLDAFTVSSCR